MDPVGIRSGSDNLRLLRGSSSSSKSEQENHSISLTRASRELMNKGIHTIVSLKDGNILPPEVEDMASEFVGITRGEIDSLLCTLSFELKETTGNKILKRKMLSLKDIMKKILGKAEKPFCRFDKIKFLYIPLFDPKLSLDGKMKFSLIDNAIVDIYNKEVSSVEIELNQMSMSEISMNYFVRVKDMDFIQLYYEATNVPIVGRAYGFVSIAFYVHKDFSPAIIKTNRSMTLKIDSIEGPIDINKTSSVEKLCKKIQNEIKLNKNKNKVRLLEMERECESRKSGIAISELKDIKVSSDEDIMESKGEKTNEELNSSFKVNFNFSDLRDMLPRNIPYVRKDEIILDTSAPNHWIYNPNFVGTDKFEQKEQDRHGNLSFSPIPGVVEMKLGVYYVRLKDVFIGSSCDNPLISYTRLLADNIIDGMIKLERFKSALVKNNVIIFYLTHKNHGRMVFDESNSVNEVILG